MNKNKSSRKLRDEKIARKRLGDPKSKIISGQEMKRRLRTHETVTL